VFHSCLIIFNLFGWIWEKTRKVNLVIILLTALSWFFLGIWYGYGYCPSTDWHWQVRAKLGYSYMPDSYTKFLVDSLTGWNIKAKVIDVFTLVLLISVLAVSVFTNIRDWKRKQKYKVRG
jgi:hypothetical protein